ncbi:hypothetical protein ACO2Q8_05390 [Larkinella sp. VNQ87]|uniref:hypothetical protein n=1 Tax=Larkinella sp. VNQ87 TaxID=3400921 RepID=UPI003C067AF9
MNRLLSYTSLLVFFSVFALVSSCAPDRNENTKAFVQELNDRKIKRITNAQLVSTVDDWGKVLVQNSGKALTSALTKNTGNKSLCTLNDIPVIQKLEKQYAITIGLLTEKDTANPALHPKERELLAAYQYNAQNKLEQITNIQKINDTLFVYNAPVDPNDLICKTCADQATLPFAVWRVVFNKREVIRRIDPKKLK